MSIASGEWWIDNTGNAGLVMDIPAEDSIVFGEDSFYSLAESGLIPAYEAVAKGRLYE